MIRKSFIFLDRVGQRTEQKIWESGVEDWESFMKEKHVHGISSLRKGFYNRQVEKAKKALYNFDANYFTRILKNGDMWRLYNFFKEDAVYLDIETSGYYGDITVIGMYDGNETKTMVRGFNLDKDLLKKTLKDYKLILTFNGSSFDLPVIERYFQGVVPDIPHIDLRHVCSKIGLVGGLKKIEKTLKIKRADDVLDVTGEDAVYLWQMYRKTGNKKYLNTLIQYNEEDIINLKPIAEYAIERLWWTMRNNLE